MRVNARFEGEAEEQINYLAEATGSGVSEVLRVSVRHYYEQLRAQRGGLTHFAAFVGRGHSGRSDIASSVKERLAEGFGSKHQGAAYVVHEPKAPWVKQTAAPTAKSRKAPKP
ncbi:MAG: ribbon-helix-helix domain-containing protein [Pseudomonadales bacterium]|jgi:hypothetical protein|nr:ribbon-helix-helix domain-containing protein [Pseudomonadales bacterium]